MLAWLKLYADEWLRGSTRFELSPAERSVFIDLMAMARLSKHPGVVCAGKYGDGSLKGYPKGFICGTLVISEALFESTIQKCTTYEKIIVTYDSESYRVDSVVTRRLGTVSFCKTVRCFKI